MGFYYSQFFVTPVLPAQSFAGQTVIITGANVGLGLEAARHIARLQASKVILAVRNLAGGEDAKQEIERSTGRSGVCEVWELDLASYASVIAFANRASSVLARLDVVVENAAMATAAFTLAEGHERTITVNVLNTLLLSLLLLPKLRETARNHPESTPPRLTVVVSETHAWTPFPERKSPHIFNTLDDEPSADMANRYASSKLMAILLLRELVARMSESAVVVNMVNPGLCHSQLARDLGFGFWLFKLAVARSTEVGSRTLVAGAAAGPDSHGTYMTDGRSADRALSPFVRSPEGQQTQRKLWSELVGILEEVHPGVVKCL